MNKQFDTRVHIRNPKTGKIVTENHYVALIRQNANGATETLYERPPGSGFYFYPDGSEAVEASKVGRDKEAMRLAEAKKSEEQRYFDDLAKAKKMIAEHEKNKK